MPTETLKGSPSNSPIIVQYYPGPTTYGGPKSTAVLAAADQAAVMFLGSYGADPEIYYLTGEPDALLNQPSSETLDAVRNETERTIELAERAATYLQANKPPLDDEIAALIEKATVWETAVDAVCRLLYLGGAAAPAMIHRIDDRRPIAVVSVTQSAWPGNFEGWVHYGPETVEDLIELASSRAIGTSFGGLHNGGNELQRRRAVEGWRAWLGKKMDL